MLEEVEIHSEDIPGWLVASDGPVTVALDITLTEELREEGIARELINRIQNLRKDSGFDVTDKISVKIQSHPAIDLAINHFREYIGNQTLAGTVELAEKVDGESAKEIDLDDDLKTIIAISRFIGFVIWVYLLYFEKEVIMTTKTRYSDEELAEFKELILAKLEKARNDFDLLKKTLANQTATTHKIHRPPSKSWRKGPPYSRAKKLGSWHSARPSLFSTCRQRSCGSRTKPTASVVSPAN